MRLLKPIVFVLSICFICRAANGDDLRPMSPAGGPPPAARPAHSAVAVEKTSTPAVTWEHAGRLRGFAFSRSDQLVAANADMIVFWNIRSVMQTAEVTRLKIAAPVTAFALAPKSDMLAVAGQDGVVRFWNLASGAGSGEMKASENALRSIIYSPDSSKIVTGDDSGRIAVWNAASKQRVGIGQGHSWPVTALAVSPDNGMLVSGAQGRHKNSRFLESELLIWEFKGLKKVQAIEDSPSMWLSVLFWPNANQIALSGAFKKAGNIQTEVRLIRASDASHIKTLVDPGIAAGQGVGIGAASLADERLVTCGPGGALLWESADELQHVFDDRSTSWATLEVCVSPDRAWMATVTHSPAEGADRNKDESYTTSIKLWKLL